MVITEGRPAQMLTIVYPLACNRSPGSGGRFLLETMLLKESGTKESKIAQMEAWGIRFELIQPVEGKSIFTEFLEKRGEGVHHLDYLVDDVDEATAVMAKKGFKPVFSGKYADGGAFAHFDTDKTGGTTVELCSLSTDYS